MFLSRSAQGCKHPSEARCLSPSRPHFNSRTLGQTDRNIRASDRFNLGALKRQSKSYLVHI